MWHPTTMKRPFADHGVGLDHRERADARRGRDLRRTIDHGGGMDAGRMYGSRIQQLRGSREGEPWMFADQQRLSSG